MAEQFPALSEELIQWIEQQPMYFVGTAAQDGQVNVSPKGQDSLRVLDANTLLWLNLTGSGNETAAHLADVNRMTIMWCAFSGPPRILRVYGQAATIHPRDKAWQDCTAHIPAVVGARQYYRLSIDLVQTSCGYAVPQMDLVAQRDVLTRWSEKRGAAGIEAYWAETNQTSLDGKPTHILS